MSNNKGPLDDLADVLTGEAAIPDGQGLLERIRQDASRRRIAEEAADRAGAAGHPVHSMNEPDEDLTMEDYAVRATESGADRIDMKPLEASELDE